MGSAYPGTNDDDGGIFVAVAHTCSELSLIFCPVHANIRLQVPQPTAPHKNDGTKNTGRWCELGLSDHS